MRSASLAAAAALVVAATASAATLTVTPEKPTYQVGETIVLDVFGDSAGETTQFIFGRLLFDPDRASYITSSQQPLLTGFGMNTWTQNALAGGVDEQGFGDAFNQIRGLSPGAAANTLSSTVTLLAESAGSVELAWNDDFPDLTFFSITDAPGTSVLIVPEPSTAGLLAFGLVIALFWRRLPVPSRWRSAAET